MEAIKIPGVNGGAAVSIGAHLLTPALYSSTLAAKRAVLKEAASGLGDVDADVKKELLDEARTEATMAQGHALVCGIIRAVDPSISAAKAISIVDALDMDVYQEIMAATSGGNAPLVKAEK